MIAARTHVDYVECTSMVFHSSAKVVVNALESTKLNGAEGQRQRRTTSLEMKQRMVESGTSAKLVGTSVKLVGDDFYMVARQKQIQTGYELSVWKSLVVNEMTDW